MAAPPRVGFMWRAGAERSSALHLEMCTSWTTREAELQASVGRIVHHAIFRNMSCKAPLTNCS